MYHTFFIHSSLEGHLDCFHVLSIVNGWKRFMLLAGLAPRTSYTFPAVTSLTCHSCAEDPCEDSLAGKTNICLGPWTIVFGTEPQPPPVKNYEESRILQYSQDNWCICYCFMHLGRWQKTPESETKDFTIPGKISSQSFMLVSIYFFLSPKFYSGNTGHGRGVSTCSELHDRKGTLSLGNPPLLL